MKRQVAFALLSAFLLWSPAAGAAEGGWELLGRQEVTFKRDRDRITVGKREGTFRQIQVKVKGAPLEMNRMTVTFANGETFSPDLRERFKEKSMSREIDLPDKRRAIKSIEFDYRSIEKREGKATVSVYGR